MVLKSKSCLETEVEHVVDDAPERFVLTSDGRSYTVMPSGSGVTVGDLEAVSRCPAPNAITDGAVVRVSTIHDRRDAAYVGKRAGPGWVNRFQVLSSAAGKLRVGDYHAIETFGSYPALRQPNPADPAFVGVFDDVTERFLREATDAQLQARMDMGRVFQRLCVDIDPSRVWASDASQGIVFAGNFAPALDELSPRERAGLLLEAGFASAAAFAEECLVVYPQTREQAATLASGATVELSGPDAETLDYHRLHSDERVQDECYAEMIAAAAVSFAGYPVPDLQPTTTMAAPRLAM